MCKLLVLANAQLGHQRTKHDRIVTITTLHTSPIRGTAFLNPAEDLQPGRQLTCVSKLNYKHYPSPKDYIREDILMVLNQVHPSRCATSNPSQQGICLGLGTADVVAGSALRRMRRRTSRRTGEDLWCTRHVAQHRSNEPAVSTNAGSLRRCLRLRVVGEQISLRQMALGNALSRETCAEHASRSVFL